MKIVTIYENRDLPMKKALDRYLVPLSRSGHIIWSVDLVSPGENVNEILHEQLENADLVLLLTSQNFWDSQDCYDLALRALALSREQPVKRIVPVLLRPNSIEDTPFKELEHLPAENVCITQYSDPEQGYWDTYQGLKKIIYPIYQYKSRPIIAVLQACVLSFYILLSCCLGVLGWPLLFPAGALQSFANLEF
ncbi:MAG: TIR domain-containing protein [Saprospiraceae bacterium]